ncbi:uncharacterized protein A4U43_C02F8610 [Asparagus officinalis]|uniref:Cytochrome P450 n=1 Tax=Asparagus officinalis TaxID=4686 RepID=A0A5P1FJP4_ASPOF|nr:uncharacterized protein A4U43_C02F8610 [Asparagus officinalis]
MPSFCHFCVRMHPSLHLTTYTRSLSVKPMASLFSSSLSQSLPDSLMNSYFKLFVSLLAFSFSFVFILKLFKFRPNIAIRPKTLKLPPGPKGWPIVGNLFQVARSGKPFIHYVRDVGSVYGPIFTLRMGSRTLIIVTNANLAHEALIAKGPTFASRPAENPTRTIFSSNKFTVNSAAYGPEWRSLRRNMVSGMLSSARLKQFRPARESAMDRFIDRIRNEAQAHDGAVWVLKNARFAVFCILLAMCFGLHLDEESIIKIDQLMKKVLITLTPRMDDYLPLLRPFFSKQFKNALQIRREQIQTLVPLIKKRQSILQNPNLDPDALPFSYSILFDLKVDAATLRPPTSSSPPRSSSSMRTDPPPPQLSGPSADSLRTQTSV